MARKLNDWLDSYLEYSDHSEPSHLFRLWSAVGTIGGALQRKCYIKWDRIIHPNQYIVLIGPSGSGKSTAMRPCKKFLKELNIPLAPERVTNEGLIDVLAESFRGGALDPKTGKITPEHCSLTVFSSELVVFLGYRNQRFTADLTDIWDGDDDWMDRRRSTGNTKITGVFLNLVGGTTPELLYEYLPPIAIGGGFTARVIFVYAQDVEKDIVDPFETNKDKELADALQNDLFAINRLNGQFTITQNVMDEWAKWYLKRREHPFYSNRFLSYYASRRPTHLLKLMTICRAARWDGKMDDMIITVKDFYKALTILEETEKSMPRVFAGIGRSQHAPVIAVIMDTIRTHKTITFSDLQRRHVADLSKDELWSILQTLQTSQFLTITMDKDPIIKALLTKENL